MIQSYLQILLDYNNTINSFYFALINKFKSIFFKYKFNYFDIQNRTPCCSFYGGGFKKSFFPQVLSIFLWNYSNEHVKKSRWIVLLECLPCVFKIKFLSISFGGTLRWCFIWIISITFLNAYQLFVRMLELLVLASWDWCILIGFLQTSRDRCWENRGWCYCRGSEHFWCFV